MRKLLLILGLALCAWPCFGQQVLPINSGVVIANMQNGSTFFKVPLTANVTSLSIIGQQANVTSATIIFQQDNTGERTVTFASNITGCTVTATANASTVCVFTYDPATASWFSTGSGSLSLPTTLTAPGVFTNTQMNENFQATVGSGCSPSSIFAGWNNTNFLTDGITATMCVPSTSSNDWSQAVAAYTQSQGAHSVVGFGSVGEGSATGAKVWGANLNLFSDTGMNSQLFGLESDISPVNTGDTAAGIFLQDASSVQPTGSFRAIEVDALTATSGWNIGLLFDNGAIASNGVTFQAISIGTQRASGNPDHSQTISFHARNSGGTALNCSMELLGSSVGDTADGVFGFGQCPLQVTGITSVGTQSISGCSLTSALGGPWSGSFHSGTAGTCTVTVTMKQASNGFACKAQDTTTVADVVNQTAFTTTTATLSGTTASGDVITWSCLAF